jgi:hypothetical protein
MKIATLVLAILSLVLFNGIARADYIGEIQFQRIFVEDNWCYVQVTDDVPNTCSYFYYRFKFDTTTNQGKIMYSALLMAKALNSPVDIWYTASTLPGTDENNGCNPTTMAVASAVAFQ